MTSRDRKVSKYTTSRGVPWSEVLWKDLPGMVESGYAASLAILAKDQAQVAADVADGRITPAEAKARNAEARKVLNAAELALRRGRSKLGIEA